MATSKQQHKAVGEQEQPVEEETRSYHNVDELQMHGINMGDITKV